MQFTKPGDPEPSTEEKKTCETETIKERHVITKRVLQIDGEDAFLGELGEVGASAAINLKSRLK